ncbi:MAG: Type IV secretory pathway VirB4 component-like protein [candidate division WWE3 bacterium GW2011_GWB1_42_41]|nr:MAG: Type IV secretory pathway VirB4 component-like protein [candidate division WWE3 bacterium GW2011_GWB1_42_41]
MGLNLFTIGANKSKQQKQQQGKTGEKTPAQVLAEGMLNVRDIIAPSAIEVDFTYLRIGNMYFRTIFVSGYPRFVGANWLSPIINFEHTLDVSMFYYPVKSKVILDDLRRKITELEATTMTNVEKGKIIDPVVSAALEDAKTLQEQLVKGVEKYFQFSFYITMSAETPEELESITSKLESTLGALLLISKVASLQMEDAFQSSIPTGLDKMLITRNMDTTSLATTFPFTSSDLTMEEGIMYGINRHNGSLVIFDRFSLENANSVVFAKSGSGKSYFVKLEEEYRTLCEAVGGNYIDFSANSTHKINPFDLSGVAVEGENELGQKLIGLITLLKLMLGGLTASEEAILDRALIETYRIKGITTDPDTQSGIEPPVMEDLYKVLMGASEPEAKGMAERLERFIKGSMTGIFDSQSNINLDSKMTVFSTKHLEEALRPIAFYLILDFVWTRIRRDLKKRILIVEEAWYLMQNEDSARFIYGIAKRARKYYLGLTTISQDVDDFLSSEYGKAIVTNSSIQILLKQHPAGIDKVAETFYLSEGEKRLLLAAAVGEGLFFAGANHVAIKVMASEAEHKLITTNPEELLKLREQGLIKPLGSNRPESVAPAIPPVQKPYEQIKQEPTQDTYTITDTETSLQLQGENKPQENKTEQPAPSNEPSSEDILRSVESLSKDQGTINLGNTPSQPGPAAPME